MKKEIEITNLLPLNEVLILLYLCYKDYINIPSFLIELPYIGSLPFIEIVHGEVLLSEMPSIKEKENPNYENLRRKHHTPPTGYTIILNDKQNLNNYINKYIKQYESDNFLPIPVKFFNFNYSYKQIYSLLKTTKEIYPANTVPISMQLLSDNKIEDGIRFVEILLYMYLYNIIEIKEADISFVKPHGLLKISKTPIDINDIEDIPNFTFYIQTTELLDKPYQNIIGNYCGIQILQNDTVRYIYNGEEKVINIKKNTYEFKFLKFLVLNKGKSKSLYDVLAYVKLSDTTKKSGKKKKTPEYKQLEQLKNTILDKFKEAIEPRKLSFDISCSPKGISKKSKTKKAGYYIYEI